MEELQQAQEAARTANLRQVQGRTQEVQRAQDPDRTQELQRVREVQRTQELKHVREAQRTQEPKRNSQASGAYGTSGAFGVSGQGGSGSAPEIGSGKTAEIGGGGKAGGGAVSRGVRKPSVKNTRAQKNSVDTGSTRKLSTGDLGVSRPSVGKSGSQKPSTSEPRVSKPSAENAGGGEGAKRSASAGKPRKSSSGQTVHRRKPTHRPGMSALIPDVEKSAPEEEFSTKATVSFFDGAEPEARRATPSGAFQNPAEDADFDPYAAADAAFEAGYADDEPFETKKTVAFSDDGADGPSGTTGTGVQGNGAGSPAGTSSTTASPTGKTLPPKPAHPSLRYRIASVAMGLKAASNDPNEQGEAKPSGRSIVMPTGGKKEAVSDFVEAVSEKRPHLSRGRIITIAVEYNMGRRIIG